MTIAIPKGEWRDGRFRFPIRVYYEDTDMGGMVYHGHYISFFERIRTESVRGSVTDVELLFADGLFYVVRHIDVTYHRQAKAGDLLIGTAEVKRVRSAALEIHQTLLRGDELVAEANVLVALVNDKGRPTRWPEAARAQWETWRQAAVVDASGQAQEEKV